MERRFVLVFVCLALALVSGSPFLIYSCFKSSDALLCRSFIIPWVTPVRLRRQVVCILRVPDVRFFWAKRRTVSFAKRTIHHLIWNQVENDMFGLELQTYTNSYSPPCSKWWYMVQVTTEEQRMVNPRQVPWLFTGNDFKQTGNQILHSVKLDIWNMTRGVKSGISQWNLP